MPVWSFQVTWWLRVPLWNCCSEWYFYGTFPRFVTLRRADPALGGICPEQKCIVALITLWRPFLSDARNKWCQTWFFPKGVLLPSPESGGQQMKKLTETSVRNGSKIQHLTYFLILLILLSDSTLGDGACQLVRKLIQISPVWNFQCVSLLYDVEAQLLIFRDVPLLNHNSINWTLAKQDVEKRGVRWVASFVWAVPYRSKRFSTTRSDSAGDGKKSCLQAVSQSFTHCEHMTTSEASNIVNLVVWCTSSVAVPAALNFNALKTAAMRVARVTVYDSNVCKGFRNDKWWKIHTHLTKYCYS